MADQRDAQAGHLEDLGRVLVVIPTYNERDNLGPIVGRLHAAVPAAHVLVVDDGSPDGTGELADEMAAADERVHVLHRTAKEGLGAAYIAGFRWAMERDYDVVVEMDADGSHPPEELPRMLDALGRDGGGADLVIGSRYVPGGRVVNWPWHRQFLSRGANLYAGLALGAKVRDMTAGYRAYRREVLEKIQLGTVASQGYCFQIDLAWRTIEAGFAVVEVPITFTDREVGQSKMSANIVREALLRVTKWGLRRRGQQLTSLVTGKR
ncbi:dolichol-phosphate mannosyltransferase [Longimycelium tulufanense]|uniref:Dolichol-phosphate mannosyltransferase n=1 Tax=Longimycelium tulufanense TaxID=907463 RepID=A0A8J3CDL1_9PSEU|nr:polyprenol monophosphomannose synthase [Longimycelium tulufanense]GGM78773.1 dolichol-phosphate mannosyltransferase [Longimycelium tulufanense]